MQAVIRAYNFTIMALAVAGGAIVVVIFGLIIIDVSIREFPTLLGMEPISPPSYTINTVEYLLLYFTMCSAPFLARNKGHVFIEAFTSILPIPIRRVLEKIVYLCCALAALLFAYLSADLLIEFWVNGDIDGRGIDIPMYLLFVSMPPGFFLVSVEYFRFLAGVDTMYTWDLGTVKDSI